MCSNFKRAAGAGAMEPRRFKKDAAQARARANAHDGSVRIPGNDDVALVNARLGRWSLRLDFHHHHASSPALDRDELEAEAEIATRDVSVFLKPCGDTLNGSRRNH
jgi:hypothetical protein